MASKSVAAGDLPRIDALLAAVGRRRDGDPTRIEAGTLNRNYRVPTDSGAVFARRYRPDHGLAAIREEHAVTRWGRDRGAPAVAPLSAADGSTVVEIEGERWSLFPWIDGLQPVRGTLTPGQVETLGEAHGRIQRVFADHPRSDGSTLGALSDRLAWDTAVAEETLDRVEHAARQAEAAPDVLEALAFRRELLHQGQPRPFSDFAHLPCQLVHGDFHDEQVLFASDDTVLGVVDWERVGVAAPVWELIRSLSFSLLLETERLEDYLRGYRRHVRLAADECRDGIELWWQLRLNTMWVYEACFLQGNERVAPLFPDTDAHLRRFADPTWRAEIADRLATAATAL